MCVAGSQSYDYDDRSILIPKPCSLEMFVILIEVHSVLVDYIMMFSFLCI